jgi:hypothetical protein
VSASLLQLSWCLAASGSSTTVDDTRFTLQALQALTIHSSQVEDKIRLDKIRRQDTTKKTKPVQQSDRLGQIVQGRIAIFNWPTFHGRAGSLSSRSYFHRIHQI